MISLLRKRSMEYAKLHLYRENARDIYDRFNREQFGFSHINY
jgi:hypothetical protein